MEEAQSRADSVHRKELDVGAVRACHARAECSRGELDGRRTNLWHGGVPGLFIGFNRVNQGRRSIGDDAADLLPSIRGAGVERGEDAQIIRPTAGRCAANGILTKTMIANRWMMIGRLELEIHARLKSAVG